MNNTSDTSAGFAESIRRNAGKYSVGASKPVGYPDSQAISAGPKKGSPQARQIEEAFNRIASDHYGQTTSYGSGGEAYGYEATGRVFDMFV
ncbi:MAG: hypothetical protein K5871_12180 [Lachnospiraceae bacterium]|nr:hypothetical protein [Lachnospiraceae bacterium]